MLATPSSKFRFVVSRPVAANHQRVFDLLVSEAGMKAWLPMCKSARWQHPPGRNEPGVGSIRLLILGPGASANERIVAYEKGLGLHYTFADADFALARLTENYVGVTEIEPTGSDSCILRWASHFDASGIKAALAPVLAFALRPMMSGMTGRLKALAERG